MGTINAAVVPGRFAKALTAQEIERQYAEYTAFAAALAHEAEVEEIEGADHADFPAKLQPLFIPMRHKVVFGGRGGSKSWGIARALLTQAANRPLRICCFREVQKNIKESVHQLLKDQIQAMGLGDLYDVQEDKIIGANGSLFIFAGLSALTEQSIKSYEGIDIAWIEEAQGVRESSWRILLPTVRKPGSEIWISMNPELETDPTYRMFIGEEQPDSVLIEMNWRDNPWFPPVLERLRAHQKRTLRLDEYNNIWEGQCRAAVQGAIYAEEISEAMRDGRVTNVPYDYRLAVHVIFDLGWNDTMFVTLAQRTLSEVRIIGAFEFDHTTLNTISAALKQLPYNWGTVWLPHDGAHGDYKTGKSTKMIMMELGWKVVRIVPNLPVETGIKRARLALERCYFDRKHAGPLVSALRRYKRNLNTKSEEFQAPVHDAASHGADCFRYLSIIVERMTNHAGIESRTTHNPGAASYAVDPEMGM